MKRELRRSDRIAFVCVEALIRQPLRSDDKLILVDFERILAASSNWPRNYERAGKEQFCKELEAASIRRGASIHDLHENHLVHFNKS